MTGACFSTTIFHTALRCPDFSAAEQLVLYLPAVCFLAPSVVLAASTCAMRQYSKYATGHLARLCLVLGGLFAFVLAMLDERASLDADVSWAIGFLSGLPVMLLLAAIYKLSPALPRWLQFSLLGLASNVGLLNGLVALLEVEFRDGKPTFADLEAEQHTMALANTQLSLVIVFCALLAPFQAQALCPGRVTARRSSASSQSRHPDDAAQSPRLRQCSHHASTSSSSDDFTEAPMRGRSVEASHAASSWRRASSVSGRRAIAALLSATLLFALASVLLLIRHNGFAAHFAASILNALGYVLLCAACFLNTERAGPSDGSQDPEALQRHRLTDPFKASPIRTVASTSTLRTRAASPRASQTERAGVSQIDRAAYLLHGNRAKQHWSFSGGSPPHELPESPTTRRPGVYAASLAGDKCLAPELELLPLRRAVSTPLRGSVYEKSKASVGAPSFLDVKDADFGRTRTSSKNSNTSAGAVSLLRLRRSIAQLGTVFRSGNATTPASPTEFHAAIDEAHSAAYSAQSLLHSVDTCSSRAHRRYSTGSASSLASQKRFSASEDSTSCKRDSHMPWADAADRMPALQKRAVSPQDERGDKTWRFSALSDVTLSGRVRNTLELDTGDVAGVASSARQDHLASARWFARPQGDRSSSQDWRAERRPPTPLALDVFKSASTAPQSHAQSASLGELDAAVRHEDGSQSTPLTVPSAAMMRSQDATACSSAATSDHSRHGLPPPMPGSAPTLLDLPLRGFSPPWTLPAQFAELPGPQSAPPSACAPPTGSAITQQRQHLPALIAPSPTRPHAHKLAVHYGTGASETAQQPSRLASPRRTACLSRSSCEEDAHAYRMAALLFGNR